MSVLRNNALNPMKRKGVRTTSDASVLQRFLSTAIPMILPSSGSVGNNGALTLTTALHAIYAQCYLYFPAGALYAGSIAGAYYTAMTSTTQGTVYNDRYQGGVPSIPSSPTGITASGPGAYTQTTNVDITLLSTTLPGGLMGPCGALLIYPMFVNNNSAGNKSHKVWLAGVALYSESATTATFELRPFRVVNKGVPNANVTSGWQGFQAGSALPITSTIDTSIDTTLLGTCKIVDATDYCILVSMEGIVSF